MRIAQVVSLLSEDGAFGGPATVALEQSTALARAGHEVTVIAGWDRKYDLAKRWDGHREMYRAVFPLGADRLSLVTAPGLARRAWTFGKDFDVVHIHLGRDLVSMPAAAICALTSTPFVVQTHGMIGDDLRVFARVFDSVLTRRVLRRAQTVLHLTKKEYCALARVGRGGARLSPLRNGIAIPLDRLTATATPVDRPVVFLARLHKRKRVTAFLAMIDELAISHPDLHFVIAGHDEGDLGAVLDYLRESPFRDRVEYRGALNLSAARQLLASASVFVLPSFDEPYPMTILEALSLGVPVVTTDSCDIAAELAANNAAEITDGSPAQLADAVRRILQSPEVWNAKRLIAHEAARRSFSIDEVAVNLSDVYDRALA